MNYNPLQPQRTNAIGNVLGAITNVASLGLNVWSSSNQLSLEKAKLDAQTQANQALIQQYEEQNKLKLTDLQKQTLLNEQAKAEAEAAQKKTQTIVLGGLGAITLIGIIYAIVKR